LGHYRLLRRDAGVSLNNVSVRIRGQNVDWSGPSDWARNFSGNSYSSGVGACEQFRLSGKIEPENHNNFAGPFGGLEIDPSRQPEFWLVVCEIDSPTAQRFV
jgi:hypothetical protein